MPFTLPGALDPRRSFRARMVLVVSLLSLLTLLLLSWLVASIVADQGAQATTLKAAVGTPFDHARDIGLATLLVGLFVGALTLPLVWVIAGRLSHPMRQIARAADQIRSGMTQARIPVYPGQDEMAVLSQSLAKLVDELDAQKQALLQKNQKLELAAQVFAANTEGIVITDAERRILTVNRAFCAITGYSPDEVIGQTPAVLASGRHDAAFYQAMWQAIETTGRWQGEIYNRRKDGSVYPEWLIISRVRDEAGRVTHYIGIFTDISERKSTEARVDYLAKHDMLTGLPNRTYFLEEVEAAIGKARQEGGRLAVLFVDLDRFKNVNDSLGHHLGDLLLKEAARRFATVVGQHGFLARWGGDEFVVLLRQLDEPEKAMTLAHHISHALGRPFEIADHHLTLTSSVGVAVYPDDGDDLITLTRNADTAMFHAKAHGRDHIACYTPDMNARANERLQLENDIRRAIALNQFSLVYQPQIELKSGTLVGVEALLRWQHPRLGAISPAKFIPVAEDTGLIVEIGEWVLRQACAQQMRWEAAYGVPLRMAVNLSPVQFQDGQVARVVKGIVAELGMNPSRLELEITENVLMTSDEQVKVDLYTLKEAGFQIALDDFGTGYSSLRYISELDIHKIKIDQTFIRTLHTSGQNVSIVAAIIAMCHGLGISVLAEGIETQEAADILRQMGCEEGQGYFFGRPLAAEDIERLLSALPARRH